MKKIIWISSYPKSGNTWMRFLISNYFFNIKNEFNFQIADKNILMFPQLSLMKKIVDKQFVKKLILKVETLFFLKTTML